MDVGALLWVPILIYFQVIRPINCSGLIFTNKLLIVMTPRVLDNEHNKPNLLIASIPAGYHK